MTIGVFRQRPTVPRPVPGAAGSVRVPAPVQVDASAAAERRGSLSEALLERGGLGLMLPRQLVERCACGGLIEAEDDAATIADAVHVHNSSTEHAQWAIGHGWRR